MICPTYRAAMPPPMCAIVPTLLVVVVAATDSDCPVQIRPAADVVAASRSNLPVPVRNSVYHIPHHVCAGLFPPKRSRQLLASDNDVPTVFVVCRRHQYVTLVKGCRNPLEFVRVSHCSQSFQCVCVSVQGVERGSAATRALTHDDAVNANRQRNVSPCFVSLSGAVAPHYLALSVCLCAQE